MSVRAPLVILLALLFSGGSVAQAELTDETYSDDFDGYTNNLDPPWQTHNLIVVDNGNKLVACGDGSWLGTAWRQPETDKRWEQDKLEVECEVDLKGANFEDNVNAGACFRSAAILVYRGGSLVTARVYVRANYEDVNGILTRQIEQVLEVAVKQGSNIVKSETPIATASATGGILLVSGKLSVELSGPGINNVKASFGSTNATVTLEDSGITHVGIQIRRPANGRDSPTIDNLESKDL